MTTQTTSNAPAKTAVANASATANALTEAEQLIVAKLTIEKAGRIINKSIGHDLRVERFLASKFQVPKRLIDKDTMEKALSTIEAGQGYGNVRGIAVALSAITKEKVAQQVEAKTAEFAALVLNEDQIKAVAEHMPVYQKFLENYVNSQAIAQLKQTFGVSNEKA